MLKNPEAENAVISCLIEFGQEAYIEINDIISTSTCFHNNLNSMLWDVLADAFDNQQIVRVDGAIIANQCTKLGYGPIWQTEYFAKHLDQLYDLHVPINNAIVLARTLRKQFIINSAKARIQSVLGQIEILNGTEKVEEIIGTYETPILELTKEVFHTEDKRLLHINKEALQQYLEEKKNAPVDIVGLDTGFTRYNSMLGQGLRFGSNLVAAPFKSGKSLLLLNVALNQVLKEKPIPIYYVNAEMDHEDTLGRMIANITETNIYDIETGKFAKSVQTESRVQNRVSQLGDLPFYHLHAVDMSFDEQLHRMKNWLFKHVGLDTEQQANPCLIVYDYIKVMGDDGKRIGRNIREDMVVGEIFSKLHEFGKQYGVYVLTAAQMNRMGEVGLSIRLEQSANNICFLREKTDDEKQQERGGNFRLRLHASRYSARMVDSDYLNLQIELPHFRIQEGKFRREIIEEDLQQSMNPTVPTSNSLNM